MDEYLLVEPEAINLLPILQEFGLRLCLRSTSILLTSPYNISFYKVL